MMLFEEKSVIAYKEFIGTIHFIGTQYITFIPNNSQAVILVYKENWKDVTVLEVSTTP